MYFCDELSVLELKNQVLVLKFRYGLFPNQHLECMY